MCIRDSFWVIDDEFASYEAETKILKERHPDCEIHFSKEICDADVKAYACLLYTSIPGLIIGFALMIVCYGTAKKRHYVSLAERPKLSVVGKAFIDAIWAPVSYTHLDVYKRQTLELEAIAYRKQPVNYMATVLHRRN